MALISPKLVNEKQVIPLITGILFVMGSLILLWAAYIYKSTNELPDTIVQEEQKTIPTQEVLTHTLINGKQIPKEKPIERPFAVMIDNHPDARPQFGISEARVVYEIPVEGTMTRYLALFQNSDVKKIGPVRSARDYYIPIALEHDADYIHAGGSPQALKDIKRLEVNNVNEISYLGPDHFWRDPVRFAPHNLYTASNLLESARDRLDYPTNKKESASRWKFAGYVQAFQNGIETSIISIDWARGSVSDVTYEYNTDNKVYERSVAGKSHRDARGAARVTATTVIIQHIPQAEILDSVGRIKVDTLGTGEADICFLGTCMKARWKKESTDSLTNWYDENNQEIIFPPGTIWISVVPEGREVSFE